VSVAEPGQIVISEALHKELPGWPTDAVGPFALRGFDQPVHAYKLGDTAGSPDC
jgi:class 3 adenylate cyclase